MGGALDFGRAFRYAPAIKRTGEPRTEMGMGSSLFRIAALELLLAVVAWAPVPAVAGATAPIIKKTSEGYVVELPQAMQQALAAYDPSFTSFSQESARVALGSSYEYSSRQTPFAIVGDFNADGTQDVALSGYTKAEPLVLALLSEGAGFKAYEVNKRLVFPGQAPADFGLSMYLTLVPRGTLVTPHDARPLRLKTDAIEVHAFEKAAVMYYFTGGRFRRYITGD